MSRGHGWWGTAPLVVGAIGLLLLVFGAPSYEGSDEINARAKQEADGIENLLNQVVEPKQYPMMLQEAEAILKRDGKAVDLRSLVNNTEEEVGADIPSKARQRVYDAWSDDRRDVRAIIAGRVAFYAGLVVVFAAGVLLYRRAPESNHGAW